MSSSSHHESFASPAICPGSSRGGVLAPSCAKSTPEFASQVQFKWDEKNPPALPVEGLAWTGLYPLFLCLAPKQVISP